MKIRKERMRRPGTEAGREITTVKSPERAKQDMEFGESMEADMNRYSCEMEGKAMDSSWKNGERDDGNRNLKNLEAGQEINPGRDLEFVDKMYTPDESGKNIAGRSKDLAKTGTEFGRDYELEVQKQTTPNAGSYTGAVNRRPRSSIGVNRGSADTEFAGDNNFDPDNQDGSRTNKSSKNDKKVY